MHSYPRRISDTSAIHLAKASSVAILTVDARHFSDFLQRVELQLLIRRAFVASTILAMSLAGANLAQAALLNRRPP